MNVLFLNVGRRVELVEAFSSALRARGGGQTFGTDISPLAPGLQVVDRPLIFQKADGPQFETDLFKICKKHQIGLVVPTIDPDLIRLAKLLPRFESEIPKCRLLLSGPKTIELCGDKTLSKTGFWEVGLKVAKTFERQGESLPFPIFVRPKGGSAGVGARKISSHEELVLWESIYPDLMLEEFIEGEEYTVDVLSDFEGLPLLAIPRRRIRVRGGEVVQGVVERNSEIEEKAKQIAHTFGATGPTTVQFLRTSEGTLYPTEVNARMGGGLPLTIAAGADWCGWILDLCEGKKPNLNVSIANGLMMTRCDRSFFISSAQMDTISRTWGP